MKYKLAVIGACGNIGHEILQILADKGFKHTDIAAVDHKKLSGREVSFGDDHVLKVEDVASFKFADCKVALFGERELAETYERKAAADDAIIISYDAKLKEEYELIIPEVNGGNVHKSEILQSPEATVVAAAMALKPLHDAAIVKRAVISTYQAVSMLGKQAMDELFDQTKSLFSVSDYKGETFAKQIAFNVIPHVGQFTDSGDTEQELKIISQLRRIYDEKIEISATCVYVPVFVGNSMTINVELEKSLSVAEARQLFRNFRGIVLVDKLEAEDGFVTPAEIAGDDALYVGRIRSDKSVPHGLNLWVVCDNLRKGSALNMVQTAELLLK